MTQWVLIIMGLLITGTNGQMRKFCDPYTENLIKIEDLPELSQEFQASIQLTLPLKNKTVEILTLYDYYDGRAELITDENVDGEDQMNRQVFFYKEDELLNLYANNKTCSVRKLSEVPRRELFFGFNKIEQAGYEIFNMDLPEQVLHFRQPEFTFVRGNQTIFRGIPVDHFKSCQNWPLLDISYHIDYFFTKPGYKQGVAYDDRPVPIAAIIEGNSNRGIVRNEYNYFKYRTNVEKRKDLFSQPEGYWCEGQTDKKELPQIPYDFSYVMESISSGANTGRSVRVSFAYESNIASYELIMEKPGIFGVSNYKIIHDFNSGVSYTINKETNVCEQSAIDTMFPDSSKIDTGVGQAFAMKNPQLIFYLDDSYFYAGQRYDRGRQCDVFVSKRDAASYTMLGYNGPLPAYWLFEIYFLNLLNTDNGIDNIEKTVPVTLKISAPNVNATQVLHFYDFDTYIRSTDDFDFTSQCFTSQQKKMFAIKYMYPYGMNANIFRQNFELKVRQIIYLTLLEGLSFYNFSPFRLVPTTVKVFDDHFVLYTGFTDRPEDIKHFTKTEKFHCDLNKAKDKVKSSSAEECASACLDSSTIRSEMYKCLSFDYSNESKMCGFYGGHLSEVNVDDVTAPLCDHYSKTVDQIDAVTKETVFRAIEDLVLRGEFSINIPSNDDPSIMSATFVAVDFFPSVSDFIESDLFQPGTSSFFLQFLLKKFDFDYNLTAIFNDDTIFLRSRELVSIDECSRLCLQEPAFICESLTFSSATQSCKWSSLGMLNSNQYLLSNNQTITFNWFARDVLFNYERFPEQTTSVQDNFYIEVESVYECANICSKEPNTCRSFNLCQVDGKYKCVVSSNHVNSVDANPEITYSPICDHYSRRSLFDYQLVPNIQLSVKPQLVFYNWTAEKCALSCEMNEKFVCRSFDFLSDENTCYLYRDNLKDGITGIDNMNSTHYSRLYFFENGIQVNVEPQPNLIEPKKYSSWTMFFVSFLVISVSLVTGIVGTFFLLKLTRKKVELPSMEFINPNYLS